MGELSLIFGKGLLVEIYDYPNAHGAIAVHFRTVGVILTCSLDHFSSNNSGFGRWDWDTRRNFIEPPHKWLDMHSHHVLRGCRENPWEVKADSLARIQWTTRKAHVLKAVIGCGDLHGVP